MKLFDKDFTCPVSVQKDADEAVLLAVRDLQRDLMRLSGKKNGFEMILDGDAGIIVRTEKTDETESYSVSVEDTRVVITGSDALGTVFGVYAFSTQCLQILPTFRFTDLFPKETESLFLDATAFSSLPRKVRFRGWFVNDEDLLSEMKESGHKRDLDYGYYNDIMDPEVLDAVIETALRLEYNLIIPATLLDIDNPAEEKLVETAFRRGLYISQHHIEPMGLSGFTAENFLKKNGRNEAVSFISNRPLMEELWRYYAKKWSKYASRVVWQLGLRGKKDEAVWKNDPSAPLSMADRGGLISDAIGTQHKILCEILGHSDFYSTTTLWNEGSTLYGSGHLTLPEGTVPVLADFGIDQMFGEDMFTTKKEEGRQYGVYYHTSFWALGPHMVEGCHPHKMAYSYRIAAEKDCLFYSMLNVSNVRPMHFSISVNAALLQDPEGADIEKIVKEFDRRYFGEYASSITPLRYRFYDAFADFGEDLAAQFAKEWFFFYHRYPTLPFIRNAATDGQLTWLGKYALLEKLHCNVDYSSKKRLPPLEKSRERLLSLLSEINELREKLPQEKRLYFSQFLHYQTLHLLRLTDWAAECLHLADKTLSVEERKNHGALACKSLETLLEERRVLETGKWHLWHKGDKKMNLPLRLRETKNYMERL